MARGGGGKASWDASPPLVTLLPRNPKSAPPLPHCPPLVRLPMSQRPFPFFWGGGEGNGLDRSSRGSARTSHCCSRGGDRDGLGEEGRGVMGSSPPPWHGVGDKVASSLLGLHRGRRESVK